MLTFARKQIGGRERNKPYAQRLPVVELVSGRTDNKIAKESSAIGIGNGICFGMGCLFVEMEREDESSLDALLVLTE